MTWYLPDRAGFAFGPQPSLVLTQPLLEDLIRSSTRFFQDKRKREAYDAFRVWKGEHKQLIAQRITLVQAAKETQREMCKHIDVAANPGRDISRDLCRVWSHGVRRTVEGASDKENEALQELIKESWLDVHLTRWNQLAFIEGPLTALPVVRNERMTWDVLLPHFYDIIRNAEDPFGPPLAASWGVVDDDPLQTFTRTQKDQRVQTIIVDADSWIYAGDGQAIQRIPHGVDRFPGSTLRLTIPYDRDWWGCDENKRLVDGSITIGAINAALSFVRKAQNKKLLTLFGQLSGFPKMQRTDPEQPVVADVESPSTLDMQALDFDTGPENFIKHALWYYQVLAQAYGGQVVASQNGDSGLYATVEFSHDALTEIRNEQIPFARAFEHDLIEVMVRVAKASRHRLADDLPDPEKVREGYRVEFPRLSRSFSDPKQEMDWWDWQLGKGATHHGALVASLAGNSISDEEGAEKVQENVDKQIPLLEKLTKRDLTTNPQANTDLERPSQMFGSMGGKQRADNEADNTEEE